MSCKPKPIPTPKPPATTAIEAKLNPVVCKIIMNPKTASA